SGIAEPADLDRLAGAGARCFLVGESLMRAGDVAAATRRLLRLPDLTHTDVEGRARMVDVSDKAETDRVAVAGARVVMRPETVALTAASVAALTIYDMCKSIDRAMVVTDLRLLRKSGGKSGDYQAPAEH